MIIGLFIDLWNWNYTRTRIKLLKASQEIWTTNKLKLSILGVLYTIVEVDKAIPANLVDRYLTQRLSVIDDALVAINLDGLIHFKQQTYAESDTIRYVLVKFIPNMPHWTWKYFLSSCFLGFVIYKLFTYFEVWPKYIKPIFDVIIVEL